MFVCCECCVLSGRGLCDELITHPEESYRLWRVVVCDQETSIMRRIKPATGLWKIQSNRIVTPRKQTNKHSNRIPRRNECQRLLHQTKTDTSWINAAYYKGNVQGTLTFPFSKHLIQDIAVPSYKCVLYTILIYLLTAIGLSSGGSSTVHIYIQTIHRTTKNKQYIEQHNNLGECGPCPVLASYTLAFALQLRKKHGKTQSGQNLSHDEVGAL